MQSLETMVLQLAALKEERRTTVKDLNERIKELEQDVRRLAKEHTGGQPGGQIEGQPGGYSGDPNRYAS